MQPSLIFAFGLPPNEPLDLHVRESGQHQVRLFELVNSRVSAARAAFPLGAAAPMQVRIDAPEHGVDACFLQALLPHPQHDVSEVLLRGRF